MTILRSHSELDTLPGGKLRLTQYLKAIAYDKNGAWTRITNVLGDSGDPNLTIGVNELVQFRLRDRLAGQSPIFHFGKGNSHVKISPLNTANVQGIPVGDNGWRYPAAWPNADLQLVIGGHILRKNIYLRSGHPASFAFRIDDHANFDPDTLSTPDFRVVNPVLENQATGESIGLTWVVSTQGGKYILTCNLPQGDYAGWVLDPTLTLQPGAADGVDAHVRDDNPTTNFGTGVTVRVGEEAGVVRIWRTFIKFDLSSIPSGATITSAIASLYAVGDLSDNARTFRFYRQKRAWVESQVTWNIYSTGNNWQTAGGFGTDDCEQTDIGNRAFTATETLNEFKDFTLTAGAGGIGDMIPGGSFTNNGFLIKADTELDDAYEFDSSDHATAADRPKLVVEYTLPKTFARAPMWGRF